MRKREYNILNNYWGLLKNLNTGWKLDLIERLTRSIRENLTNKSNKMKLAFGAWESENSAEDIIEDLRKSRTTDRQIESL